MTRPKTQNALAAGKVTVTLSLAVALCVAVVPVAAQRVVVLRVAAGHGASNPGHPQSYLGVGLRDVSEEQVNALRLHDARGAEIIMVDHDGPAGKAGLRTHDVVLQMNGQQVDGQEQLRHMLRDTPPGHQVTLTIWRDGQQQAVTAQLADRGEIEKRTWQQHFVVPQPSDDSDESDEGASSAPPAMHGFFGNHIYLGNGYTGVALDVMEPQLATYFGCRDGHGLLVKSVEPGSPAAIAGLRAGDVVVRVNGAPMSTRSEWLRTMHDAKGKMVALTVMRDRRAITMQMGVDTKKRSSVDRPRFRASNPTTIVFAMLELPKI